MSEAKLNFNPDTLDHSSALYDLYSRLYQGMHDANEVDAPDFTSNPPYLTNSDGSVKKDDLGVPQVDHGAIATQLSEFSDILMKNSAYLFANAILTVMGGNSSGGGTAGVGFVSRNGDTMVGKLSANYGFESGMNGTKIFETIFDVDSNPWAIVTGSLRVTEDATVGGQLNLSEKGIYFGGNQVISYGNSTLNIVNQNIAFKGDITVDGTFELGQVTINQNGIFWDGKEFYHSGNSNKSDVDWTMKDANVYGNLDVKGTAKLDGRLTALKGFDLGELGQKLFYSEVKDVTADDGTVTQVPYITLATDLSIVDGYGIKFDDLYIVKTRTGSTKVVSFSAPGMVMNLGDSNERDASGNPITPTQYIALQANIKNYNGAYDMVSYNGDGNFPNSFSAGCYNSGPTVIRTFATDTDNCGIVVPRQVRFGSVSGPMLYGDGAVLKGSMSYTVNTGGSSTIYSIPFSAYYGETTSLFKAQNSTWSATLRLDTDAEFFGFEKPIEAIFFSVKSEKYKTRLQENALFFDDGKFLEGVTDGIRHTGNSYFDGSLSSFDPDSGTPSFSSGFAGKGWAIMEDETYGGIHATFDTLTIRKKARFYELEVQKISVTNGSLWVSDSCSGDEVREIYHGSN